MTWNLLLAGFGGQGILFAGKLLVSAGMHLDKNVSWLPSYGPEMRGGTANCSVIISDDEVASPLVVKPDMLMAMNAPSLDKFEDDVTVNGIIICDSTLVLRKVVRSDVRAFYIPATQMAIDNDLKGLANVIMVGKIVKETGVFSFEELAGAIEHSVPASKKHLIEPNTRAAKIGYDFKG